MQARAIWLLAVPAWLWLAATQANAACPQRLGIGYGDTLESIAQACGITTERLRGANPGLNAATLQSGTFVTVPRPALPSAQLPISRPLIRVAPPLVPPVTGISPSQTVIAPPPPPVLHHFEIPGLTYQPDRLSISPLRKTP